MKTVHSAADLFRLTAADGASPGTLMATLFDIQSACHRLPEKALDILARRCGYSLGALHSLVVSTPGLTLERRAVHRVAVCGGSSCRNLRGRALRAQVEQLLGISVGETSADGYLSLHEADCFGGCVVGPMLEVDGMGHRPVTPERAQAIIGHCRRDRRPPEPAADDRRIWLDLACPLCRTPLGAPDRKLDAQSMVKLRWTAGSESGWAWMSSWWGDPRVVYEPTVARHRVVQWSCPHCDRELRSEWLCHRCDAPLIPLSPRQGGEARFCARRGCQEHLLDLGD